MLQKLNLIMNQTLPATYDDSLSYYEALSKICYEVNEIIDKINSDEALIAANSEAITSINSQITSINNSLSADAEKIQQHTTQINGLLQSMQQLAGQVNDLDDEVTSFSSSISSLSRRVNDIESNFETGFETPYITITSEILPGSPADRAATKGYVDSKISSEAITSINSQITSINNSLSADAEKIQQHTTQINGLLQSMQQLAGQVNDLDDEVTSFSSSISSLSRRVNDIESNFETGFETPYITITSEILPGSPADRAATKGYVDSKISSEFTPIVLTGNGGPAVLTQMTVRFDKTGLIIYGSISQDELPSGGYEVFTSSTLNTLANGISAWVGDALASRSICIPIFKQPSSLDSPTLDSERWFEIGFNSSGVLAFFSYVKASGASTTAPNFVAQTVI